jgi:hypothetical protein
MAVNVYTGQAQPIQLALTAGKDKDPVDAAPLNKVTLDILDRETLAVVTALDSSVDANVFFWNRTQILVKGVLVWLLELELHASSIPLGENYIARLTLYDGLNPLGITWKQFAMNVR